MNDLDHILSAHRRERRRQAQDIVIIGLALLLYGSARLIGVLL